jgi:prevent-host-death family protein
MSAGCVMASAGERVVGSGAASCRRASRKPRPPCGVTRKDELDICSDRQYNVVMKQLSASKFKEQCLALLDRVDPEGIVVTKRGKPVAKLIPFGTDSADLIGSLKHKLRITGEILSTGIRWDAER